MRDLRFPQYCNPARFHKRCILDGPGRALRLFVPHLGFRTSSQSWTGYESALLVLSFSPLLDVAASFRRAVAAAALSVCADVAVSLRPTQHYRRCGVTMCLRLRRRQSTLMGDDSCCPRLRWTASYSSSHSSSLAAVSSQSLVMGAVYGIFFCVLSTETEKWLKSLHAGPQGVTTSLDDTAESPWAPPRIGF